MTPLATFRTLAAASALLALAARPAQAQLAITNYKFNTATTASLAATSTGTAFSMASGTTTIFGPGANNVAGSAFQPIGFDFYFYGQRFTQFSATLTGLVSLQEENLPAIGTLQGGLERFGAFQRAQSGTEYTIGTSVTGKVHYKVVGAAPNRVLVVEYLNMSILGDSGTPDGTWQMRFYEGAGVVEYVYGSMSIGSSGAQKGFQVGLTHKSDGTATQSTIGIATSLQTARYSVAAFSGVNAQAAGAITALNSTADGQRRNYLFDPSGITAPTTPTSVTVAAAAGNSLDVSFADGPDEIAYEVYYSTACPDFGLDPSTTNTADYGRVQALSGTAGAPVTVNIPNLKANTRYYVKVFALREGLSAAATASSSTTLAAVQPAISQHMQVFPNPGRGAFTLDVSTPGAQSWQLLDAQGRQVAAGTASTGRQPLATPSALAPGLYVLRLTTAQGVGVRKLVVE